MAVPSRRQAIARLLAFSAAPIAVFGCAGSRTSESFGEYVDDSVITSRVKSAFVADQTVRAMDINVETFKGTVQLAGFANTPGEASRAVEIARSVPGVQGVRNDIRVKTG